MTRLLIQKKCCRGLATTETALLLALFALPLLVLLPSITQKITASYQIAALNIGGGSGTTMQGEDDSSIGDDPLVFAPDGKINNMSNQQNSNGPR